MARSWRLLLAFLLGAGAAWGAEPAAPGVVKDYEGRLEEIAREVQDIRRSLEELVAEVVEGEMGRLLLFLDGPAPAMAEKGVSLTVDDQTVVSRPLTPAEIDVLGRGLPLELAELRVKAGEHRVALAPLGAPPGEPGTVTAQRGKVSSWVGKLEAAGVAWRAE